MTAPAFPHHVPAWLFPLLGAREKTILSDPNARMLAVDEDGHRLPAHQQIIESAEHGSFTICAQRKEIIG